MRAAARHLAPTSSTTTATPVPNGGGGYLVLTEPWPSMLRGIWGDDRALQRDLLVALRQGYYFAGDGAKKDDDGDLWLLGRVDDVMNVSGHRISTTEVESALVSHPTVAEAAVVGATDATTGQAHRRVRHPARRRRRGRGERRRWSSDCATTSAKEIGPIAKPRQILVVPELPKTRSGKIMRRLLRDVAENRELGDVTTLADSIGDGPDPGEAAQRGQRGLTRRAPSRRTGAGTRPCCSPRSCVRMRYFVLAA